MMSTILGLKEPLRRLVRSDDLRLGIQAAVAAVGTFAVMDWVERPDTFVATLSAVFVIGPSIGGTIGQARDRILSTALGSAVGVSSLLLLPEEVSTQVALALSMILMKLVAGARPNWHYGVVAAVALSLGGELPVWEEAMNRCVAIVIGGAVGTLVSLVVRPERAESRALSQWIDGLRACAQACDINLGASRTDREDDSAEINGGDRADACGADYDESVRNFERSMQSARLTSRTIKGRDSGPFHERLNATQHLWNSLTIVGRVAAERGGVSDVLDPHVTAVQESMAALLQQLIDSEGSVSSAVFDETVGSIDDAVGALRMKLRDHPQDEPREHVLRAALTFGFGEMSDSCHQLREACSTPAAVD